MLISALDIIVQLYLLYIFPFLAHWIGVKSILRESCDAPKLILLLSVQKTLETKIHTSHGPRNREQGKCPKISKFAIIKSSLHNPSAALIHNNICLLYIIYLVRFIIQFTKKYYYY